MPYQTRGTTSTSSSVWSTTDESQIPTITKFISDIPQTVGKVTGTATVLGLKMLGVPETETLKSTEFSLPYQTKGTSFNSGAGFYTPKEQFTEKVIPSSTLTIGRTVGGLGGELGTYYLAATNPVNDVALMGSIAREGYRTLKNPTSTPQEKASSWLNLATVGGYYELS